MKKNVKIFLLDNNSLISNVKKTYKKTYKKPFSGEAGVQKAVIDYLKYTYPGVLYCASAGGVWTGYKQAKKMVATGYVKGFPDLFVCEPRGKYHGLLIEIKDIKGVVSKEQKQWIKELNERGYYATYSRGFESTIKVIDDYFKGEI